MTGIMIKRAVTVKARMTEKLKRKMAFELQEALRRLDLELKELDLRLRPVASNKNQVQAEMEEERARRLEQKAALLEKLRLLARLELGTEVVQGSLEGMVELSPGDNWERVTAAEIVLEDGVVVEIRNG